MYDAYIIFLPTTPSHYLTHDVFKYFFYKKLPNIKPIEKQEKTIEGILLHVFHTMVTKKTLGVSSNLFAPCRNFASFLAIDFQ